MRSIGIAGALAFAVALAVAGSPPGGGKTTEGYNKLKSLVGEWAAKDHEGNPVRVSYKLVSEGNSLEETLAMGGKKDNMVTIYHLDADKLMLTHYCSMGNQPRMKADLKSQGENKIVFNFVDITNLAGPASGHMRKVVFNFKDKGRFTQEWTMRKDGKDAPPMVFDFVRVESES